MGTAPCSVTLTGRRRARSAQLLLADPVYHAFTQMYTICYVGLGLARRGIYNFGCGIGKHRHIRWHWIPNSVIDFFSFYTCVMKCTFWKDVNSDNWGTTHLSLLHSNHHHCDSAIQIVDVWSIIHIQS